MKSDSKTPAPSSALTAPTATGILTLFAEAIRQVLVVVYDIGNRMTANGEALPAGVSLAVEEISIRLLGEDFDTFEDRVRADLKEKSISILAAELEQALAGAESGVPLDTNLHEAFVCAIGRIFAGADRRQAEEIVAGYIREFTEGKTWPK